MADDGSLLPDGMLPIMFGGLDMALSSRGWAAEYRTPAFRALSLVQTHKARTEHTEHHRRVGFNDFIVDAAAGWLRLAASLVTRSMY